MTDPSLGLHHPACPDHDECDFESGFRPQCWVGLGPAYNDERVRAHAKHGVGSAESLNWDDFGRWLSIIMEEVGEVGRAVCEFNLGNIGKDEVQDQLTKELVQVGAMAEAWVMAVKRAQS